MTSTLDEATKYLSLPLGGQLGLAVLVICVVTRITSAQRYKSHSTTIPPYWIPYFGHFVPIFYNWRSFLQSHAKYIEDGILTPYILGRKTTIIVSSSLTDQLLTEHQHSSDPAVSSLHFHLLRTVFGAPSNSAHLYQAPSLTLPDLVPAISLPSKAITKLISARLPDLVSFNSYIVDQFPWERPCSPQITKHPHSLDQTRQAARVPLVTLVTQFIGHVLSHAIMGPDFMQQYPQFLDDLADLDGGYKYLALGLPRWVPPTNIASAYIARKRLLAILSGLEATLDRVAEGKVPEEPWEALIDGLSEEWKARSDDWRSKGASVDLRASVGLAVLWATYAQTTTLTAWMLIHIWSTGDLWAKIKSETSAFAKVKSGPKILAFSGSSSINIEDTGLLSSSPLLLACFNECAKRYLLPHATLRMVKDVAIPSHFGQERKLERGTIVMCGISISELQSRAFEGLESAVKAHGVKPMTNQVRFNGQVIQPNDFVINSVLATVAGVIALWEILPINTKPANVPQATTSSPCARPVSAFSVYLSQVVQDT